MLHATRTILIALTLSLPTLAANSQQTDKKQPEPTTPTVKVYSRETVVDTTVTDSKGNPVHGLLKPDFTIKEDRKPQTIRGFEEFSSKPQQPPPKLPPNVYTNLQPLPASGAVNILLLDFVNTAPDVDHPVLAEPQLRMLQEAIEAQHNIKVEATKYLQDMPVGTRASVIGMSWPSSLRVLQGFTFDPALLSAAVNSLNYDTNGGVTRYDQWCAQQDTRDRMTLESLNQIAADLVTVKGRKNLIWFTVGIPSVTDPSSSLPCQRDYSADLAKTYGLLTAAQIALYPVDARGVIASPPWIDRLPPSVSATVRTSFVQKVGDQELSMDSFAEATGGAAYYNSNDLAGLMGKAIGSGSNYYTLTYVPPGTKYNGSYHTIKLAVDQPDLHLIYRKGYTAEDPAAFRPSPSLALATTLADTKAGDMRTAMSRSLPTSTDLLFDVQVEPSTEPAKPTDPAVFGNLVIPKLIGKPLARYSFQYVVPARQLTFTPTPEGNQKTALEFDIAAYDAEGKLITSLSQSIQPIITAAQREQLLKGPFRFFQQLDLPPGALFLRIGILDPTSHKIGTLEIPLTVAKR